MHIVNKDKDNPHFIARALYVLSTGEAINPYSQAIDTEGYIFQEHIHVDGGRINMNPFKEIKATEIRDNPIQLIGQEWMLVTAGKPDHFNTMTASWGSLGEMWFKPVCFCFVRPQRYTYEFMEANDAFTLSFFDERYKPQLNFCGSRSGRESDKAKECGFTPVSANNGSVFFNEARIVLECKKLYFQDLNPVNFIDDSILKNYPQDDFHRMYIGEITRVLLRD